MKRSTKPRLKFDEFATAGSIVRIEAISNYCRIYFSDGSKLVVAKLLRWFQGALPVGMFVRVHRGHLVNKFFIKELEGKPIRSLLMQNGESIKISRRRKRKTVAAIAA